MTRKADSILDEQKANIKKSRKLLHQIKHMACLAREELLAGNLDIIGELLHESWVLKKQLASRVSNSTIDAIYDAALKAGAMGGKITGAGGGGFFLLYCPYDRREAVRDALSSLEEVPFNLEPDGSKVIFNYRR
jgi:D-glycero-alpha-D-manno-heptose-7-phosphate kinase